MARPAHRAQPPWYLLLGVALLALGLGGAGGALLGQPEPRVVTRTVTMPASPAPRPSPTDPCATLLGEQRVAITAAAAPVREWDRHIAAMQALVADRVSWADATAFWEAQRPTVPPLVTSFKVARATYQARDRRACAARLAAGDHVLAQATACVDQLHHHAMDMDAVRAGELSRAEAARRWTAYWRETGKPALAAYRAAQAVYAASR